MAEINHAWHVLGDAARRIDYDRSLRASADHGGADPVTEDERPPFVEPRHNPLARYQDPPRVPWRFMGVMLLLGVVLVVAGVLTAGDPKPRGVDNVLQPGDCVVIDANGDAAERLCTEEHDGTVAVLLAFDSATVPQCPDGSEPHRDRQGMGTACVTIG